MYKFLLKSLFIVLLSAIPQLGYCQYFQGLYDVDSSQDWGWNIFIKPDSTYFIFGTMLNRSFGQWGLFNMQISKYGSSILCKNTFKYNEISLYDGNQGEIKILLDGEYLIPFSIQRVYGSQTRAWSGILKTNKFGDTIFKRTYTDTSFYWDAMNTCAIMVDKGYALGGLHAHNTPSYYPAYIIRTDSFGDTLWTHTYKNNATQFAQIHNILPLADGRIIVGAISTVEKNPGPNSYYYNTPWYMLLDSMGNIIRDTLYTTGFQDGGFIYNDLNGGYITMGGLDSLYTTDPIDIQNFPSYIAHLDSNFRTTWITTFPYTIEDGHREIFLVRQLHDSSYIVLGDKWTNGRPGNLGWAAKVSKTGNIIWSHSYQSDTIFDSHFRAMVEKPDGSLVFVGTSFNDTLPRWRQIQDVWLVGTDSNGCENEFCAPTAVPVVQPLSSSFSLFPNPSNGEFSINCTLSGAVIIYNMQGQQVGEYKVMAGLNTVRLPVGLSAGLYIVKYMGEGGRVQVVVRLVYEQ